MLIRYKNTLGTFIFCYIITSWMYSQNNYLDSLKYRLEEDSIKIFKLKKYLPILIFDSRNSIISSAPTNIIGLRAGILLNEKDILGVGGYWIYLPFKLVTNNDLYELKVYYFTLFYQKSIWNRRFHKVDLIGEVGLGRFKVHKIWNNEIQFVKQGNFRPLGLSIAYTLKPLKWLGIQGMLGYRWMLQKEFYDTFSGPFYSIGIWFSVKDFIRFIKYNCIAKRKYKKEIKNHLY